MKAYKGFNKDMTCRGFQFEEGKTYEAPEAKLCNNGFHACKLPLDCLRYYGAANSVYHEVELDDISDERSDDSKVCGKKITVGAEIGIPGIVKAHLEIIKSKVENSGDSGNSVSGYRGNSVSGDSGNSVSGYSGNSVSGDRGNSVSGDSGNSVSGYRGNSVSGDRGNSVSRGSASVGENGLAVVRGNDIRVKGGVGSVLVIVAENEVNYDIKEWKAAVVDGKTIKADTWYTLEDGEFVEVKE